MSERDRSSDRVNPDSEGGLNIELSMGIGLLIGASALLGLHSVEMQKGNLPVDLRAMGFNAGGLALLGLGIACIRDSVKSIPDKTRDMRQKGTHKLK